jgi:glutathione synthase/RimK-type ligase-like ATP-grasp enzyme
MILVVSYPDDEHTIAVVGRLRAAGREVALLDLSSFPARSGLELGYAAGREPEYLLDTDLGRVDATRARAGWWRRVRPYEVDPIVTAPHERVFAASETGQAIGGLLDALPCEWVNDPRRDEAAHHKPLQWAVAHRVGLAVPRTLVTNDPDAGRRFVTEVGVGSTVCKAFLASAHAWRATRLVDAADVARMDAVRFAPVIFQEYVPGVDLRVTIVGRRVLAAEIDASRTRYPVDMRVALGEADVRAVELPRSLRERLLALMARLGLRYGALDLRRGADGTYHFLEVNPAGQWLFVEDRTGLPISDALAGLLAGLDAAGGEPSDHARADRAVTAGSG